MGKISFWFTDLCWWREFFPKDTFWNSKIQVSDFLCYITLLLLTEGVGWEPGGTEDQLQNSWPCSDGNMGEGNGSLSWDRLGAWSQDQAPNCPVLLNPQPWCQSCKGNLGLWTQPESSPCQGCWQAAGRKHCPCGCTLCLHQLPLMVSSAWAAFDWKLKCSYLCRCTDRWGTWQGAQRGRALAHVAFFPSGWWCCPWERLVLQRNSTGLWPAEKTQPKRWRGLCTPAAPRLPCVCLRERSWAAQGHNPAASL